MVGMCLYLGRGWLHTPMFVHPLYICTPPVCLYAPIHSYTPWECTPPRDPPCFCAPAWFWHIACCGGLFFCFMCIGTHHPYLGVPPPLLHPHTLLSVLCALLFSGISVLMWAFPLLLKGLGVFPHHWGRLG